MMIIVFFCLFLYQTTIALEIETVSGGVLVNGIGSNAGFGSITAVCLDPSEQYLYVLESTYADAVRRIDLSNSEFSIVEM